MSKTSRVERAIALEQWAETIEAADLVVVDTSALKELMALAEQRSAVENDLAAAVRRARAAHHSWSEIGMMLGVSKQAAQRRYGRNSAAA